MNEVTVDDTRAQTIGTAAFDISPAQFKEIADLFYDRCGVLLEPGKENFVKSRLARRLRRLRLQDFEAYIRYVKDASGRDEFVAMINALVTNKTNFFRESQHFDYLREFVLPEVLAAKKPLRIWSAGCSSGEEPYTLAIVLAEMGFDKGHHDARILATDISTAILHQAVQGLYEEEIVRDIPPALRHTYLAAVPGTTPPKYKVSDRLRRLIDFAHLNLMAPWPMKGPFDAIMCRNVMIYFDRKTRERLVQRFEKLLRPGGHLFVGHSEGLGGFQTNLKYVQPAVYRL